MDYKPSSGRPRRAEDTTSDDELPSYDAAVGEEATQAMPAAVSASMRASTTTDEKRRPSLLDDDDDDGDGDGFSSFEPPAASGPEQAAAGPSSPPSYTRHDPTARTYFLRPPVIYSSSSSSSPPNNNIMPTPPTSPSSHHPPPPPPPPPTQKPVFHLSSLRVHTIALAPLTPSNARLIALRGPYTLDAIGRTVRTVPFDEDVALYQCTHSSAVLGPPLRSLEVEGLKKPLPRVPLSSSGTGGTIMRFEPGAASPGAAFFGSAVSGRFVVVRRRRRNSSSSRRRRRGSEGVTQGGDADPEDEKRMQRYGWKPQEEWEREVLFVIERRGGRRRFSSSSGSGSSSSSSSARGSYEWKDRTGRLLAHESVDEDGAFRLDLVDGVGEGGEVMGAGDGAARDEMGTRVMREVLIACWVGRIWASGGISLEE